MVAVAADELASEVLELPPVHPRQVLRLCMQVINEPLVDQPGFLRGGRSAGADSDVRDLPFGAAAATINSGVRNGQICAALYPDQEAETSFSADVSA